MTQGAHAQSPPQMIVREPATPLAAAARADDVISRVNPMAEQVAIAVVFVGLAAALRRWHGKRPGPSRQR